MFCKTHNCQLFILYDVRFSRTERLFILFDVLLQQIWKHQILGFRDPVAGVPNKSKRENGLNPFYVNSRKRLRDGFVINSHALSNHLDDGSVIGDEKLLVTRSRLRHLRLGTGLGTEAVKGDKARDFVKLARHTRRTQGVEPGLYVKSGRPNFEETHMHRVGGDIDKATTSIQKSSDCLIGKIMPFISKCMVDE